MGKEKRILIKSAVLNHAFLHSLPVEVWLEDELIGTGRVVLHTLRTVRLDDGMHYYKHMYDFRIKQN